MPVRALSPCRGDKASPRRGLNIPATTGTRKGAEADSQHKTAPLENCGTRQSGAFLLFAENGDSIGTRQFGYTQAG